MSISRYIAVAVVRCSWACSRAPVRPVQLAEAEVAVGDEGAHAELVGEHPGLAVVAIGRLDLDGIGVTGNFGEETEGPRLIAALTALAGKGERPLGECTRVIEPAGEHAYLTKLHDRQRMEGAEPSNSGLEGLESLTQQPESLRNTPR
jgi:hypothetical protein